MRARAILFAMLAFLASPAVGQETRLAPEGHNPPPATVAQLDWMVGQWVGENARDVLRVSEGKVRILADRWAAGCAHAEERRQGWGGAACHPPLPQ